MNINHINGNVILKINPFYVFAMILRPILLLNRDLEFTCIYNIYIHIYRKYLQVYNRANIKMLMYKLMQSLLISKVHRLNTRSCDHIFIILSTCTCTC